VGDYNFSPLKTPSRLSFFPLSMGLSHPGSRTLGIEPRLDETKKAVVLWFKRGTEKMPLGSFDIRPGVLFHATYLAAT